MTIFVILRGEKTPPHHHHLPNTFQFWGEQAEKKNVPSGLVRRHFKTVDQPELFDPV